jgi:hypothetical protein
MTPLRDKQREPRTELAFKQVKLISRFVLGENEGRSLSTCRCIPKYRVHVETTLSYNIHRVVPLKTILG